MGCISKLALFVLNFAIFAAGVTVVTLSSIIIHKDSTYGDLLISGVFTLPIIILIAGLVICLIGFLGCCGAMKESSCMLKTYAFIVTVLLLGEIILGILLLVYPNKAEDLITEGMTDAFEKYGNEDESLRKAIDNIQHDLKCCGVKSYQDWQNYTWSGGVNVSDGCCKEDAENCGTGMAVADEQTAAKNIYTRGCYEALKENLQGETIALGVVLFLMAIVQVMAITCACGLARKEGRYA